MDPANRIIVSIGPKAFDRSLEPAPPTSTIPDPGGPANPSLIQRSQTLLYCQALQSVLRFDAADVGSASQAIKDLAYAFLIEQPGSAAYLEFSFPVLKSELVGKEDRPYFNPKAFRMVAVLSKAFAAAGVNRSFLRFSLTVVD